ncbi:MAG TPA: hypothetical protein VNU72_03750, partial [Puia sp.]|nr:hypothetical protein [Puia sp.]
MRKIFLSFLFIPLGGIVYSQQAATLPALIPEPVSLQVNTGLFVLPATILIDAPHQPDLAPALLDLAERLHTPTGAA